MEKAVPRILVISHTSFTKSASMGSTMASYFSTYPPEKIAQFFIKETTPDIPVCARFYRVTDKDLLKKLINPFKNKAGGVVKLCKEYGGGKAAQSSQMGGYKHREWGMMLRKYLWSTRLWDTKEFRKWVDDFSPQMILVQPGDFSYLLDISVELSKKLDIPLAIHQSESYYLKDYDKNTLVYRLFRRDFKKSFERLMSRASCCIYLCDALKRDYDKIFAVPSYTIMKSSGIEPERAEKTFDKGNVKFLYGGNLGETVGRGEPLLELGKALKSLGFYIDVYAANPPKFFCEAAANSGIVLHGAVSYAELQKEIKKSDFIVHIESRRDWNIKDLKYAFSTKIADMLASGVCSIIYGPPEIASISYFKENDLGCVIEKPEELVPKIKELIENDDIRERYIERALKQAKTAHCAEVNSDRMKEIFCHTWEEYSR